MGVMILVGVGVIQRIDVWKDDTTAAVAISGNAAMSDNTRSWCSWVRCVSGVEENARAVLVMVWLSVCILSRPGARKSAIESICDVYSIDHDSGSWSAEVKVMKPWEDADGGSEEVCIPWSWDPGRLLIRVKSRRWNAVALVGDISAVHNDST